MTKELIKELEFWCRGIQDHSDMESNHVLIRTINHLHSLLDCVNMAARVIDDDDYGIMVMTDKLRDYRQAVENLKE